MTPVVTAEEMKFYDSYTIQRTGIPSLLLMERAAMETAAVIRDYSSGLKEKKAAVFAGTGNNGGDGLAIGRLLWQEGFQVSFCMPGDQTKASKETRKQMEILSNLGFSMESKLPKGEYTIIVDALFGVGLSREVSGSCREAVEEINRLSEKGGLVVSVDIPSGICADTGRVLGLAVKADVTVTFSYRKAGHLLSPGREHTGTLLVREIGITKQALCEKPPSYRTIEPGELPLFLPKRDPLGNKGSFGKVLLIAGSSAMGGAALLCAKSILRTGAGMVKVLTAKENRDMLLSVLPEALVETYEGIPEEATIRSCLAFGSAVVLGPGLGRGEGAKILAAHALQQGKLPLLVDADGLNLIGEQNELQRLARAYEKNRLILTPHPGEFIRLFGGSMKEYKNRFADSVKELSERFGCVTVGKDAVTAAAQSGGGAVYLNQTGNDGMATAGSGDVLSGIIGGLLAQGMDSFEAACAGVCLHGLSGDIAARKKGRYSLLASDLTEAVGEAMSGTAETENRKR